jgi:hypothetical protein
MSLKTQVVNYRDRRRKGQKETMCPCRSAPLTVSLGPHFEDTHNTEPPLSVFLSRHII